MSENQTKALEVIHRLSTAIAEATELTQVYDLILDQVIELLHVEKASVMIYDPSLDALRVVAARGMSREVMEKAIVRVGEGISGKVFARHEPLLVDDIRGETLGPKRDRYRTHSLMSAPVTCFPMKMGKETLGVINVTDRSNGKDFTQEDLQLLMTISNQAASYLHVCQLLEKIQSGERLRQQVEIARHIQYRLLPGDPPAIDGLDIAGQLVTADRVGGDYYDYYMLRESRPGFIIADVSGHSVGAAMIMAAFRAAVKSQQDADFSPATLAQRVNHILYADLYQAEQFISMAYVQYLRARQMIQFTNAGHPAPLLWRATEKRVEHLITEDPLLGIDEHTTFHEKKMVVSPGDVLLLYTDGITEAANNEGERFGLERLEQLLRERAHESALRLLDHLISSVTDFMKPQHPRDDITALVIKVC
ncbi:MAG: hypothetical protein A3C46_06600 [Deltaproteobacteria bacterium RIFCSPHIGHO2_02_FULL_44_16]|nr:MAG: hypothetical protein A3C46_06600 [Deltaproteobacteria bacterium RIFCSPHIGHO2_02_FULL_44_16]